MALRITVEDGNDAMTLKLEGRLAGPLADELDKTWHSLAARVRAKKLHVDLCGVTDADADGKQVLANIHNETGADFLADNPLAKYLAQEVCRWNRSEGKET